MEFSAESVLLIRLLQYLYSICIRIRFFQTFCHFFSVEGILLASLRYTTSESNCASCVAVCTRFALARRAKIRME